MWSSIPCTGGLQWHVRSICKAEGEEREREREGGRAGEGGGKRRRVEPSTARLAGVGVRSPALLADGLSVFVALAAGKGPARRGGKRRRNRRRRERKWRRYYRKR